MKLAKGACYAYHRTDSEKTLATVDLRRKSLIVEYLRYTIDEPRQQKFIDDYKEGSIALQQSAYCQAYEFCQCVDEPSCFIIRIQWTSAEDHLQKFRGSDEFKAFFVHIRHYLDDIDEMRHYRPC